MDDEMDMGTPPQSGRTLDIDMGLDEVITIDLDALDPNPEDVLGVLVDAKCKVSIWTQFANEYWRRGLLESAQRICKDAIAFFTEENRTSELPPIYLLLANIQIQSSRSAPKIKWEKAVLDRLDAETPKDNFLSEAANLMNTAQNSLGAEHTSLAFLTRGIHQLSKHSTMGEAMQTMEMILQQQPTNLVALHGKARILYSRKAFRDALEIYRRILRLSPYSEPDPRIGIGLCQWQLNEKANAKAAWERSLQVHPKQWVAHLLLGVEALNASKDFKKSSQQRNDLYVQGSKHVERAFSANQKNAAAANCLSEYFIRRGDTKKALKLAERAIQYADTLAVVNEGHLRAGRVAHLEQRWDDAIAHYTAAKALPLASVGLAQTHIQKEEYPAAIHVLDNLIATQKVLEAQLMLASVRGLRRPALSAADYATDKEKAREAFERIKKEVQYLAANSSMAANRASLLDDVELNVELARLWQGDDNSRAIVAYEQAIMIAKKKESKNDARLLNNVAALMHLEGNFAGARSLYEQALTDLASSGSTSLETIDGSSSAILYNLARSYEDIGELDLAKSAYSKLLDRHPEYIDAKVRQAHMALKAHRRDEAHELLKQALTARDNDLNLRSYYTYFMIHTNTLKPALGFVFNTLKEHSPKDVYTFCAAAWLHYQSAREMRDPKPEAIRERRRKFTNAAEFYEKALVQDPSCAFAAQGLAIIVAEDALGFMSLNAGGAGGEDPDTRIKNTREALDLFAKIRETWNEGAVYANMGHCYFSRDEYERAIESYETASKRFYNELNVPTLSCLSRAWYAKSVQDSSFDAMSNALKYALAAEKLHPNDKAIQYNVAMIQQKAAQMVFDIPIAKRTLAQLRQGHEYATQATQLFSALAEDKSTEHVPYSREMVKQRHLFGVNLMKRGTEQITQQEQHEEQHEAKLDAARKIRNQEKQLREEREQKRLEELKRQAETLAEERRKAMEEAFQYSVMVRDQQNSSDDEGKPKRKRARKAADADGADSGPEEEKPERKKRVKKVKKGKDSGPAADEEPMFSDEGETKRKKRTTRKRVVEDDEEEDRPSKKKKFKSNDVIEDSDEELERLDRLEEQQRLATMDADGIPPLPSIDDMEE